MSNHKITSAKQEALLNEWKGVLFEYLVGKKLAQYFDIEDQFLSTPYLPVLSQYESRLMSHDPELFAVLPVWSAHAAQYLSKRLPSKCTSISLVGKSDQFEEGDLLIATEAGSFIPLSLKLSKRGAFVNTKSGGVRSFLSKYFASFPNSTMVQENLNATLDWAFEKMALELHEMAGLPSCSAFGKDWRAADLPELPGELNAEMNAVVLAYYQTLIAKIHEAFIDFVKEDRQKFEQALLPLVGFGQNNMLQLTCFYQDKHTLPEMHLLCAKDLEQKIDAAVLGPLRPELAFFELNLKDAVLQIRIKPMNVFTVPAVKINCSLKHFVNK